MSAVADERVPLRALASTDAIGHVARKRGDSSYSQTFKGQLKFGFSGNVGEFNPPYFSPSLSSIRDWVGENLTVFGRTTPASVSRAIESRIRRIHQEVLLVPDRNYRYQIVVRASVNRFDVEVRLQNRDKHAAAGMEATARIAAEEGKASDAEKARLAELEANNAAQLADMRFIVKADGAMDLVARPVWMAEQKRLRKTLSRLAADLPAEHAVFLKSYNEAGLIARISSAYSGKGMGGYSKPELSSYWTSAREYQAKAAAALGAEKFAEAHGHLSMALWSIETAQKAWNGWLADAGRGAGTVVTVLTYTKYAGQAAATLIPGVGQLGLAHKAAVATGFAMAYEGADQTGKIVAGLQDGFDLWKIGKIGAAELAKTLFFHKFGDWLKSTGLADDLIAKLGDRVPGAIINSMDDLVALVPKNILNGKITRVLESLDPDTFKDKTEKDLLSEIISNPVILDLFEIPLKAQWR